MDSGEVGDSFEPTAPCFYIPTFTPILAKAAEITSGVEDFASIEFGICHLSPHTLEAGMSFGVM
jgi:hypothetical protein